MRIKHGKVACSFSWIIITFWTWQTFIKAWLPQPLDIFSIKRQKGKVIFSWAENNRKEQLACCSRAVSNHFWSTAWFTHSTRESALNFSPSHLFSRSTSQPWCLLIVILQPHSPAQLSTHLSNVYFRVGPGIIMQLPYHLQRLPIPEKFGGDGRVIYHKPYHASCLSWSNNQSCSRQRVVRWLPTHSCSKGEELSLLLLLNLWCAHVRSRT